MSRSRCARCASARLEAFDDVAAQLRRSVVEGNWDAGDFAAWLDLKARRLRGALGPARAVSVGWASALQVAGVSSAWLGLPPPLQLGQVGCAHCRARPAPPGRSFCCDRCRDCALVSFGNCTGFCELDDSDLSEETQT